MIILLYGKDKYRIKEKEREIIVAHKEKSGNNISYLLDADLGDIRREMLSVSMFSEKKLVIVYDFLINKDFLLQINLFEESQNILLLINEKADDVSCFKKKQEFNPLTNLKIKQWISEKINSMGGEIDEDGIFLLIDSCGNDLWRLENEIRKLLNYSSKITIPNIKKLVRDRDEVNIFETINAIGKKDRKEALQLVKKHLDKGDSPIYILAMIASQIRKIISAKDGSNSNYYSINQASNFTMEELKSIYDKIVDLDYKIKTGKVEDKESLNILICGA